MSWRRRNRDVEEGDPDESGPSSRYFNDTADIKLFSKLDQFRLRVGIISLPSFQSPQSRKDQKVPTTADHDFPTTSTTNQNAGALATSLHEKRSPADSSPEAPRSAAGDQGHDLKRNDAIPNNVLATFARKFPNRGMYSVVVRESKKTSALYQYFSIGMNVCLGIQIIFGAALTALGASHGSHTTVAALGAIVTVLAGFMTYLKGSGLPGRMKYFQYQWDNLRDYIEGRERDLRCSEQDFDVEEEITEIRHRFDEVRQDIEYNRPDRFTSSSKEHNEHIALAGKPSGKEEGGGLDHAQRTRESVGSIKELEEKIVSMQRTVLELKGKAESWVDRQGT